MLSSLELCSLLPDTLVVLSSASSYLKGSGMVCVSIKFDEATYTTGTGVLALVYRYVVTGWNGCGSTVITVCCFSVFSSWYVRLGRYSGQKVRNVLEAVAQPERRMSDGRSQ